jgi:hypothetical protein
MGIMQREVGYGLSLEGASAADQVNASQGLDFSMQAKVAPE